MSAPGDSNSGAGAGSELQRTRERLAAEVARLQWDLGGLAYEMAIRDHFRPDVLMRRAATLQERDAELAEVERLLHAQETSVAGSCSGCGAVRSRGAVYCWQCGAQLLERVQTEAQATDGGLVAADVHAEIDRLASQPAHGQPLAPQDADPGGSPEAPPFALEPDAPGELEEDDLGRPVQTGP